MDLGRPILEHSNEVLGVAGIRQAVAIGQRDAVGIVSDDPQCHGPRRGRLARERQRRSAVQDHAACRHLSIRVDADPHLGSRRGVDVAAILLRARLQPERRRIRIVEVDACHPRRSRDGDGKRSRRQRADRDAVGERRGDGLEIETVAAAMVPGHDNGSPLPPVGDLHLRSDRRAVADEARLDGQRHPRLEAGIARANLERDSRRKEDQPGRIPRLTSRAARDGGHDDEQQRRGGGLEPGTLQHLAGKNRVEVDDAGSPSGIR
ncbi:MAG TPA: hypothetical protein VK655_05795, partial [Solirubrobacteraceae bacterium]|nr:hypothetical protein [Solirubrobacteraceae bacterium]